MAELSLKLRQHQVHADASRAHLTVLAAEPSSHPVSPFITGKFCEHLGRNIVNGHLAQILHNATFATEEFHDGRMTPDGRISIRTDPEVIAKVIRDRAAGMGCPESVGEALVAAFRQGLACGWVREGTPEAARVSPDTGPNGGRAQRLELSTAGAGIAQWTPLPLHRVRRFQVRMVARSVGVPSVKLSLYAGDGKEPLAQATVSGLTGEWSALQAELELPETAAKDALYRFAVTADAPGQVVLGRVLLLPADHIGGCDPDVIRFLKESRLPLLRWPGGNFVSGYRWEQGIGPQDLRPSVTNVAWGSVEPNLFGTDEFIAFCRAVGCEPMICVNGGDGTPEEAARWVEYCNGAADTPMGSLRARNGHPEPYGVHHWEVGNELWGNWQVHWTTSHGYVDRYHRFSKAMLQADPSIKLYACGAPVFWGQDWNDALVSGAGHDLPATTDHPLIGGPTPGSTDPLDVYRDFMGVPEVLQRLWTGLHSQMEAEGITAPELAVTELQLFAHLAPPAEGAPVTLTREVLVTPATHCEALYDRLLYHTAVRLAPFVKVITHSATVNHGGGLRKERERVYANPCHYSQALFNNFAGASPVPVRLECATAQMPLVLGDVKALWRNDRAGTNKVGEEARTYATVDALAAVAKDGSLLLSLVNRGEGAQELTIDLQGFTPGAEAHVDLLWAPKPWSANTLEAPEAITPVSSALQVMDGKLTVSLPAWSVAQVRVLAGG